ncbi:thiamine-phosphate kinase [Marinicella sp. S1101]|nr:thiamine-phosphate kinase [Marinicella marina]MCX7552401.1 thiamine-phosphate kinase [Marinicella marina]MDJ1139276.1 thiamine-phosphate kinase [Marinicella marina]
MEQIKRQCDTTTAGTVLGIGDDAAILQPNPDCQLTVSTDTLVAGVHFKETDQAIHIGHKALAVNLSDMAAMGATPKWVLLNLTLPDINRKWINGFIKGFAALLAKYQVQLIGGDTTQGPLSIAVTVMGETSNAIRRDGANLHDLVVVTGEIGSAAFALHNPRRSKACNQQLKQPEPRLDVAKNITHLATAMIDVSDGLMVDLGHICRASNLAAVIELSQVPINSIIQKDKNWMAYVLAGGDDYQLCFTINAEAEDELPEDCHIIGQIIEPPNKESDVVMVLHHHQPITTNFKGYQHFDDEKR